MSAVRKETLDKLLGTDVGTFFWDLHKGRTPREVEQPKVRTNSEERRHKERLIPELDSPPEYNEAASGFRPRVYDDYLTPAREDWPSFQDQLEQSRTLEQDMIDASLLDPNYDQDLSKWRQCRVPRSEDSELEELIVRYVAGNLRESVVLKNFMNRLRRERIKERIQVSRPKPNVTSSPRAKPAAQPRPRRSLPASSRIFVPPRRTEGAIQNDLYLAIEDKKKLERSWQKLVKDSESDLGDLMEFSN